MQLLRQVRRTVASYGLLGPGDVLVVGVSGGPDSVCLLHTLLRLREEYGLRLQVAHLHHGARAADADSDARFVFTLADGWDVPVLIERQDVPALARRRGLAFEEAARDARYTFLARVATAVGAATIAVGHNADDQAETVLMHFLRGAGLAGLRGMLPLTPLAGTRESAPSAHHPVPETGSRKRCGWQWPSSAVRTTPAIIRPLLEVPRAEIERYCTAHGLVTRFDRSNLDTTYFRNRLRHELLPLLETYNPQIRARLCHTASIVAEEYSLLTALGDQAFEVSTTYDAAQGSCAIDRSAWAGLPVALQRATLRKAVFRLRPALRDLSFGHVEHARRIGLGGRVGDQATLPMRVALRVGYDTLTVGDVRAPSRPPDEPVLWGGGTLAVSVPGVTLLPNSPWSLRAELLEEWNVDEIIDNPDPWVAYLDRDRVSGPVALRTRRAGDRFRPQGMNGHTAKLGAFMIGRKIPRQWRDHIPILAAGETVLWICGHRIAQDCSVRSSTRQVLRLQFERSVEDVGRGNGCAAPE